MNPKRLLQAPGLLDGVWTVYGNRAGCHAEEGILTTGDCSAAAENYQLKNIDFQFSARAPEDAEQVDIWACFRQYRRDYRYMVGLRGGSHKHLYLARLGSVGYDQMLDLCPLEWCAIPGVWYQLRIVCAGTTIAVYVNGEEEPRILCEDKEAPFDTGCVALGGGYVKTEFKDVSVTEVSEDALAGVKKQPGYLDRITLPQELKEGARYRARAAYRPYAVPKLPETRLELSLNGDWLFIPDYEAQEDPAALHYDDSRAHVMEVPASWIPLQAWLEGEIMKNGLGKGQSDNYCLEEFARCRNLTFDYEKTSSAWYRHYIDLPQGIEQKRVVLDFEAIALVSAVYCNGVKVHENIGMFTPMELDISDYVHAGRNIIAVSAGRRLPETGAAAMDSDSVENNYVKAREDEDSSVPVSDCVHREFCTEDIPHGFYSNCPGGIWRSVRLIISDRICTTDCWFRPTLEDASITVNCLNRTNQAVSDIELSYSLVHRTTGEYLCGGKVDTLSLEAGEEKELVFRTPKVSPHLWGPGRPNLYRLTLTLTKDGTELDSYREQVGFRTVRFDGSTLLYNGKPMWVRGGNHMPAHVRPNDAALAETYMKLALEHNVMATRTHVAPWGSTWLDAADSFGLMISLEGTWPWLMISHIPSDKSLSIWKAELRKLYHRHRNRPSLFLLTMNNEMNFYLKHDSDEVIREKGYRIQGGLRIAREVLPDLPLVCDSGYYRAPTTQYGRDNYFKFANGRYERIIQPNHYDDGDMDDPHSYYGWYSVGFFHFMNGEFGRDMTIQGRPCMSQECSIGYCRAEDGLPVRSYLFEHQVPQTTTGKRAYEHNNPYYFQHQHAFQVQGLVEMFRRVEHDRTCGALLFAFETWFYHHHDSRRIQPMLSAERVKKAYQPVLASADLFGRHFYAGQNLVTGITLINDSDGQAALHAPVVEAMLTSEGTTLVKTELAFGELPYFATAELPLVLPVPKKLPKPCTRARLILRVWEDDRVISVNDYEILLGDENWANPVPSKAESVYYPAGDVEAERLLKQHRIPAEPCEHISDLTGKEAVRLVVGHALSAQRAEEVRAFAEAGGKAVLVNQRDLPDALTAGKEIVYTEDNTEIMTMNVPESSVFDGIGEFDTAWFPNGRDVPYIAYGRYRFDRMDSGLCSLADTMPWHGYIANPVEYGKKCGAPLFSMQAGKGALLISSVRTNADLLDPAASRLTGNILTWDFDEAEQ